MSKSYNIVVAWEGYSRGESCYTVEASSEAEAESLFHDGVAKLVDTFVVRDDTSGEVSYVREVT
jgi:hypothetical protein